MPTAAMPRGETIDVLVKDQSAFATFATGNFTQTYIYSHTLEEKDPFEDDPLLGQPRNNDRDTLAPAPGLPTLSGNLVVPVDFNHFGAWLKSVFGAPDSSGTGSDFVHVFSSGGEVLPEKSLEVSVKNVGGATIFMQYTGLMAQKLTLDIARAPGYQRATLDMTGRSEAKVGSSGGGTPAGVLAREPMVAASWVMKIGGTEVADIMKITATYDNKLTAKEHINGTPYIAGYDVADNSMFTGTIELRFRSATLYDDAVARTALAVEFLGTKSSVRSLSLAAPAMRLEKVGIPISGPGGIQQTFNFRAEQTDAADMLTVTFKSGVETI